MDGVEAAFNTSEIPSWETLTRLASLLGVGTAAANGSICPVDPTRLYVVRSLNQTANKPLHLGHLRNAALGAAAAGCAAALGARVLRQCVVEDTGRYMTEAMAAVADLERTADVATAVGRAKGDHFIGSCYGRYRRASARGGSAKATTTYAARNDAADALQRALLGGDKHARRLWRTVADLTLDGQQATLRELGMTFDCCDYESAEDRFVDAFLARGLRANLLTRKENGEIVYRPAAGRELRLVNSAGLTEESTRLLSLIWRLLTAWPREAIHIVVAGNEWKPSMTVYPELMQRMGLAGMDDGYAQAFYGMVMRDGRKMSSSDGSGVLVDTLLDELARSEDAASLTRAAGNGLGTLQVAAMIMKCFVLSRPRADRIEFHPGVLADRTVNPGWVIAEAWTALTARERRPDPRAVTGAGTAASRQIIADALSRISFEVVVRHAESLAGAITSAVATERERADFRAMLGALAVVPERSSFTFTAAQPLATMPAYASPAS